MAKINTSAAFKRARGWYVLFMIVLLIGCPIVALVYNVYVSIVLAIATWWSVRRCKHIMEKYYCWVSDSIDLHSIFKNDPKRLNDMLKTEWWQ